MLTPKKKLTKKELKHDPLLDSLEKGKEYYEQNQKQIITALVVVLVIILLGWGWLNNRQSTNNEAMLANTKATLAAVNGMNDNVQTELERVVEEYGNNDNIAQSKYQLGVAKMQAGDLAGARELFSGLTNSSDELVKISGKLKLALLAEKESNYGDAAALYRQVSQLKAGLVSKYATLQAGYAFLAAGNIEQATDIVDARKSWYKATGQPYYRPWVITITDGEPTDMRGYRLNEDEVINAGNRIRNQVDKKNFFFFGIGVDGADMDVLEQLSSSQMPPAKLQGLKFAEFFKWLSASMTQVVNSNDGDSINLPSPSNWMEGFKIS